ncbi:MAG: hypothetical protein JJ979_02570 [Roseibium sp.]|nr:hypothetical protein [Roseibium sp.]
MTDKSNLIELENRLPADLATLEALGLIERIGEDKWKITEEGEQWLKDNERPTEH